MTYTARSARYDVFSGHDYFEENLNLPQARSCQHNFFYVINSWRCRNFQRIIYRKIKPSARPKDPFRLVSAADCQLMIFGSRRCSPYLPPYGGRRRFDFNKRLKSECAKNGLVVERCLVGSKSMHRVVYIEDVSATKGRNLVCYCAAIH